MFGTQIKPFLSLLSPLSTASPQIVVILTIFLPICGQNQISQVNFQIFLGFSEVLGGFEVRIVNDYANERLELTETLGQALAYIEEYSMHHDDLVAFNLSTGSIVAKSNPAID